MDGVWAWTTQPNIETRRIGTGGLLPNLRVTGTALEEDAQVLMSPRCAEGRTSYTLVRSP